MPDEAELSARFIAVFLSGFIKVYTFLGFFLSVLTPESCVNNIYQRQRMSSNYRSLSNSFIASTKELSEASGKIE